MTWFKTSLTAQPGSTITYGSYVFKNNAGSSVSRGLSLAGTVNRAERLNGMNPPTHGERVLGCRLFA